MSLSMELKNFKFRTSVEFLINRIKMNQLLAQLFGKHNLLKVEFLKFIIFNYVTPNLTVSINKFVLESGVDTTLKLYESICKFSNNLHMKKCFFSNLQY
ncbi:hypothetical protein BpHYR1_017369 [Brachionus plicatilis]|uniref:Uncharacterized protein n=1 Tax=Brachionus plicatilis TaxID=10195 RepID=A0A3M7QV13_BRAPC|nr:hypothetical protein BpHYR1_017369 [Brachionus plicatilis]